MAKGKGGFIGQDGLNAPDAPTGVSGTAGDEQVSVAFTAPTDVGGSAITGYNVQAADGSGTWQGINRSVYDDKSLDTSGQDSNSPYGIAFNNDGSKLYSTGNGNDTIYQYALTSNYDVSTASYDSKSFSVASQDTSSHDIAFNTDGTKMFVAGFTNGSVYQYSLSTAYDISTASYDSVSFSISSQDNYILAMTFKPDGTAMYLSGYGNTTIYQYTLSTAYDLSTASYASKSLNVSSQERFNGISFNSDGTKLYGTGGTNDLVYQFSLTTAYDLSTASYDEKTFDVSSQATSPTSIIVNDTIGKMYIGDANTTGVYQYSLDQYPTASPVTITGLTNGTSYTFNVWAINAFGWSSPSDASGAVTPAQLARSIFAGGDAVDRTLIQYIELATTGNSTDFGDLSGSGMDQGAGAGNATRSLFGGNYFGIDYVNPATLGNSTSFGNLTDTTRARLAANATSTRCIFGGGSNRQNIIDYVTIATTGNASDFGDLTVGRDSLWGQVSSPTRAVFAGGEATTGNVNVIDYITPSSTGNATDFGDLIAAARDGMAGACSSTRGIFFGGNGPTNRIQYITIASTGNASDFGDLSSGQYKAAGATGATRGAIGGGELAGLTNRIEYVTIATTGNAADFGDLLTSDRWLACASSLHGGLS